MKKAKVIFRADGNSQIGLGHLVRSLSLAAMLKDDYDCAFAIQQPSEAVKNIIRQEVNELIELPFAVDLDSEAEFLANLAADCYVLDGYHFDLPYMQQLKNTSNKLVFIDDIYNKPFVADVIINPAGGVEGNKYQVAPYTKLYIGPEYATLREAFFDACLYVKKVKNRPEVFLVCLGGSDPENKTTEVVKQLKGIDTINEINVIVGAAYPFSAELEKLTDDKNQVKIHKNLDASQLCKIMQSCDAAICSPSTISYEWCCNTGLLFLLQTAYNQQSINKFLLENGLAFNYSQVQEIVYDENILALQKEQILNQRKYFDGKSKHRLQKIFNETILPDLLNFRKANVGDVKILFDWANDDEVRNASFSSEKIAFEDHCKWFQHKINDTRSLISIAYIKDEPAGMIRFDIKPEETVISYLLDKKFRGKSLGSTMLVKGIEFFKSNHNGTYPNITGYIKSSNTASIKAFLKAGFNKLNQNTSSVEDSGKYILKELS